MVGPSPRGRGERDEKAAEREPAQRQAFRIQVLGVVAVCLVAALFARLWYLQVLETEELRRAAASNVLRVVYTEAPRGRILDVSGRVLVDNKVVQAVVVDRRELSAALDSGQQDEMLHELATLLSRSGRPTKVRDLQDRLRSEEVGPFDKVPLAIDISADLLVYLGERPDRFPGLSVEQRTVRSFPYGTLAAHLLGYVGPLTAAEYRAQLAQADPSEPDAKTYQPGDEIGKSGVERAFESELRGVPGRRVLEVNARSEIVNELVDLSRPPVAGNDVYLTIDADIQALAESELRRGLERARSQPPPESEESDEPDFDAPAGAVVVLDPRDGDIVALASYPTFDPEQFVHGISQRLFEDLTDEENHSPILNRAIQGLYPPGSTFKAVTAYAALTQGVISNDDTALIRPNEFYLDTGTYRYPLCVEESDTCIFESPYCCERYVDLRESIAVSSDAYFYRLGGEGFFARTAPLDEGIQESARLFGLGASTGVPLPHENSGVVPDRDYYDVQFASGVFQRSGAQWYAGDTINLAIGQGNLLVTPLQVANAYAALASGGRQHQPNIAWKVVDRSGETVKEFGPRLVREIDFSADIAEPLLDGLNGATALRLPGEQGGSALEGTAFAAFNLPETGGVDFPLRDWPVAGKTGTAEKQGEADSAWFVGFGPATWPEQGYRHTPEVVVAMVLEEAGFGGEIAAPAVARILKPIAQDTVKRARTAQEVLACYSEVKALVAFLEGVYTGEIKVDADGVPISQERPSLSDACAQLVGGEEAVERFGLDALL